MVTGTNHRRVRYRLLLLSALTVLLSGCGEDSSVAWWDVGPNQQLTPSTTSFTAVVSRVGCSSGNQGTPTAPAIEYAENAVRITLRMSPKIDNGTCQETFGVPYTVKLTQPLGQRALVDGECHPGSTAWATAFCENKGVRRQAR